MLHGGVKSFGRQAFMNSTLQELTIPSSVTSLGNEVFAQCRLKHMTVPAGVSIPHGAFSFCASLETVEIAEGVLDIGSKAFYRCYNLQEVNIPGSVDWVGKNAFSCCSNLKSVTFGPGPGLDEIEYRAFSDCVRLDNVYIKSDVNFDVFN